MISFLVMQTVASLKGIKLCLKRLKLFIKKSAF
ncbi:hypothetical protein NEOC95_002090 [Neochlamydia sp. AcF95]|nr:hypothetical protein [Neochlamydia sp. AcF95]